MCPPGTRRHCVGDSGERRAGPLLRGLLRWEDPPRDPGDLPAARLRGFSSYRDFLTFSTDKCSSAIKITWPKSDLI